MTTENKTIYEAFLEAQKQIETITKDATANAGSFKYNYATLSQVMDMIKKPLNDNGLFVCQPIEGDKVITKIFYKDGLMIADMGTPIICARVNDPQAQGSAISYARRYGLMSLLCLSAEDDDGVKAMPIKSPVTPKQTNNDEVVRESIETKDGDCEVCGETLVFKTGTTKDGKKYQGYFCPNSKQGEKHTVTNFKYL